MYKNCTVKGLPNSFSSAPSHCHVDVVKWSLYSQHCDVHQHYLPKLCEQQVHQVFTSGTVT